ncbi:MAG: aspartyl/glutamyl-tRNA amidotransferase subunit A [Dehalococcoidia bacterium]|nr:aspartyl/glutamyl-tRNA amidotransferase subunit A [Dehalococcoidia bacterium]MDW8119624.1 amidase [Chloroflexota bacterium]
MPSAPSDLCWLTIPEMARLIRRKAVSPVEVTQAHLERIRRLNPQLNAFITVTEDGALQQARQAESAIARGEYRGMLHGIPVALKDLFWTRGIRTTAGSRLLADFIPQEDSTVAHRLQEAGAVLVGKAHTTEFAMGGHGKNIHYGPCRNPWNPDHLPGGSSSGSGAGVVAGLFSVGMGSDTGGSIRIPAALCGAVGIKPTFGRVSKYGVVPLSWSLDHVGPLARTVEDAAIALQVIAGHDPKDPATAPVRVPHYLRALDGKVKGIRVGVPKQVYFEEADGEVIQAVREGLEVLAELGCRVEEVSLPHLRDAAHAGAIISWTEAAAVHARWFPARRADYGPDCTERITQGMLTTAVQYVQAQQARRLLIQEMQQVLEQVDVLVGPTCPYPAPRQEQERVVVQGKEVRIVDTVGSLTRPANITGQPAVSVPCGFSRNGLPIGMQILGRWWDEATILKVAHAYQQATEWHKRHPAL